MKHENKTVLEYYSEISKNEPLNESFSAMMAMFIAGTVTGVALFTWLRNKLKKSCSRLDPRSADYALCLSRKYERLAQEFDTRSKTDCSHFENKENCIRKLEEVADNFHSLTSKWRVKYKERLEEEREEESRRKARQKEFEKKVKATEAAKKTR
jgi:hypothetical protein